MRFVLITLLLAASLTTSSLYGATWSATVGVSTVEISNVNVPGVWLSFTKAPYASHSCTSKNGQYVLGGGAANIDKMTAAATTAQANGRPVSIYWGGACSLGGNNGYPVILGLTVK